MSPVKHYCRKIFGKNKKSHYFFPAFIAFMVSMIFLPQMIFASAPSAQNLYDDGSEGGGLPHHYFAEAALSVKYDYILIIDESGSMKRNDPAGARKDAAKLFTFLSETLNPGNRVMVAGFGEKTNIYLPLTEIQGNEKAISSAIGQIQSNQDLTDMKGALTDIRSILESRKEKNKTVVIFLTDGSLTLADIPSEEEEAGKPKRDKTIREEEDDSGRAAPDTTDESAESNNSTVNQTAENEYKDSTTENLPYLDQYKADLKELCYKYRSDGIVIYPIAFTNEADISILDEIASITRGVCYKAEEARDLSFSFIEILKSITSRFIKIIKTTEDPVLSGEIEIGKYVKEMVAISLENNLSSIPKVELNSPSGEKPDYDSIIDEGVFRIVKVKSPDEGNWKYSISGDAVFVYEMVFSGILQPAYPLYLWGAPILLQTDLSGLIESGYQDSINDFRVSAAVKGPDGTETEGISLADNGKEPDVKSQDGIFSGIFSETGKKGFYKISFNINNEPTGSSASRNITVEMIELPVKITYMEPAGNFYITGKPLTVEVSMEKEPSYNGAFDINNYKLTFNATGPDNVEAKDMVLLDNGSASDKKAGDGIYSASFLNTAKEGKYYLEFFIRDAAEMTIPAFTGKKVEFEIKTVPPLDIEIKNNLFTGEPASLTASFEDLSKGIFKYVLKAPDGSAKEGILYDDGNAANNDSSSNDGTYSALISGLDLLGKYVVSVEAVYNPGVSDMPVSAEAEFSKEFQVKQTGQAVEFDKDSKTAAGGFTINSQSENLVMLSVDMASFDKDLLDNKIIKSVKISSSPALKSKTESQVSLDFELADKIRGGQYRVSVPVVIDDLTGASVEFDIRVQESFPPYLLGIVIGASVIGAAAIFLFVYFLYIRPKKRGY